MYIHIYLIWRGGNQVTEILNEIGVKNAKSAPVLSGVINHTHFLNVGRIFILSFTALCYVDLFPQCKGRMFDLLMMLYCIAICLFLIAGCK